VEESGKMEKTPIKITLVSLCASYSHTPLALYALRAYCHIHADQITLTAFTINHTDEYILRHLYKSTPDIAGFSCSIWNIGKTLRAAAALKQLLPGTLIVFGGPEMAAEYDGYLLNGPADIIIPGEGEKPLLALLEAYDAARLPDMGKIQKRVFDYSAIPGIAWENQGRVHANPPGDPLDLRELPFPYPNDLSGFNHKILYYEASRGCPFNCAYCLSSAEKNLRLRPLEDIWRDLRVFLQAKVSRVKFTDRSFNANISFAHAIWRFLQDNDNQATNFHFEINAGLLNDESFDILSRTRPGLFQFEIGVQTTNEAALAAVGRVPDVEGVLKSAARIKSFGSIPLHLDLIAGLPGEDYVSFKRSFNMVYDIAPERLQLGFLKLLKGTALRGQAGDWGMVFQAYPPYEILYTRELPYADLLRLKAAEEMLEIFYNSGRFVYTLRYLLQFFPSPFDLYDTIASDYGSRGYGDAPQNKAQLYLFLLDFSTHCITAEGSLVVAADLLRFDWLSVENEKTLPPAFTREPSPDVKRRIRAYLVGRDTRGLRVETFSAETMAFLANNGGCSVGDKQPGKPAGQMCFVQFTYPTQGKQDIFTLPQRVKEVFL
jgi:radical SAM superfamily enzyme YgiQ (UPF0313 family)